MSIEYPPSVIRLLEQVEAGALSQVRPEDQDALTICSTDGLLQYVPPIFMGMTEARSARKKAQELREGDMIQFHLGDQCFFRVDWVYVRPYAVEVRGSGVPHTWRYNAKVHGSRRSAS